MRVRKGRCEQPLASALLTAVLFPGRLLSQYLAIREKTLGWAGSPLLFPTFGGRKRTSSNLAALLGAYSWRRGVRGFTLTAYRRAVASAGAESGE